VNRKSVGFVVLLIAPSFPPLPAFSVRRKGHDPFHSLVTLVPLELNFLVGKASSFPLCFLAFDSFLDAISPNVLFSLFSHPRFLHFLNLLSGAIHRLAVIILIELSCLDPPLSFWLPPPHPVYMTILPMQKLFSLSLVFFFFSVWFFFQSTHFFFFSPGHHNRSKVTVLLERSGHHFFLPFIVCLPPPT